MEKYESSIKSIAAKQETVFAKLSDLSKLKSVFENINDERVKDIRVQTDSIYCTMSPFGEIGMRIVDLEPSKTIKFESDKSPLAFNLWIQLVGVEDTTRMKLTIKADIPIFIKGMIGDTIDMGIEMLAGMIASLEY